MKSASRVLQSVRL